jgi:hypothetical protein
LFNQETSSIPLELIKYEPMTEYKLKVEHLAFSLAALFAGIVFIVFSLMTESLELSVFGSIFTLLSVASFAFALKYKGTVYSFFFASTKTKIFSIADDQTVSIESDESISQCEAFVKILKENIINKNSHGQGFESNKDKFTFLKDKLNEIYNYGVVNETLYEIIEDAITDKIFGLDSKAPSRRNVIAFQAKKELMESA